MFRTWTGSGGAGSFTAMEAGIAPVKVPEGAVKDTKVAENPRQA